MLSSICKCTSIYIIIPREEKNQFREIETLTFVYGTHQLQASQIAHRRLVTCPVLFRVRQHLRPAWPLCFHIVISCFAHPSPAGLTPHGEPGLEPGRSFMKCCGGTHELDALWVCRVREAEGDASMLTVTSGVPAPMAGVHSSAWHPAHIRTGAPRRCLDQIPGALSKESYFRVSLSQLTVLCGCRKSLH